MSDDFIEPPPLSGPPAAKRPPAAQPPPQAQPEAPKQDMGGFEPIGKIEGFEPIGKVQMPPSAPKSGLPWFMDRLLTNLSQHGNLLGREGALETSAKMAAQRPYQPGMSMGQMMGQGRGWQENPMLYAGAPSSLNPVGGGMAVGSLLARGAPPAPQPGAAAAGPVVTEMPYRGVPQGFRPPEAPAGGLAAAEAIAPETPSSTLATAIANNTPAVADQLLTRSYRGAVNPSRVGAANAPQIEQQDQRILTAIDQIIKGKNSLKLTDPNTGQVVTGQLPRTLRQFSDALDHRKREIFQQYDQMAQKAGDLGVQVDLYPAAQKLRELATTPEVVDWHPALVGQMEQLAAALEKRVSYSPSAAQDVIENINQTVRSTQNKPITDATPTFNSALLKVVPVIREALDSAIEKASGAGYQDLKRQYGALSSIEKDVANAALREGVKQGRIPSEIADLWSGEEIMRGLITLPFSPAHGITAMAKGLGMQTMRRLYDHVNGPNKAIERLFARRSAMLTPMPMPDYRMGVPGLPTQFGGQLGLDSSRQPDRRPRSSVGGF